MAKHKRSDGTALLSTRHEHGRHYRHWWEQRPDAVIAGAVLSAVAATVAWTGVVTDDPIVRTTELHPVTLPLQPTDDQPYVRRDRSVVREVGAILTAGSPLLRPEDPGQTWSRRVVRPTTAVSTPTRRVVAPAASTPVRHDGRALTPRAIVPPRYVPPATVQPVPNLPPPLVVPPVEEPPVEEPPIVKPPPEEEPPIEPTPPPCEPEPTPEPSPPVIDPPVPPVIDPPPPEDDNDSHHHRRWGHHKEQHVG